jgi:hypothetical protein
MEQALLTDADLLARIKAFCAQHEMAPSTFGRGALGDGSLIANLEGGRSLTLRNAEKVVLFMSNFTAVEPLGASA